MRYDATVLHQCSGLMVHTKLEEIVTLNSGLESSLLTIGTESHAPGCAYREVLMSSSFTYHKGAVNRMSAKDAQERMAKNFRENAARPLFSGVAVC